MSTEEKQTSETTNPLNTPEMKAVRRHVASRFADGIEASLRPFADLLGLEFVVLIGSDATGGNIRSNMTKADTTKVLLTWGHGLTAEMEAEAREQATGTKAEA